SEPITVEPFRKSTRTTLPSGSLAVAAKLIGAVVAKVWPAEGLVRLIVGGRLALVVLPVQRTPLSVKSVGCGNGLGGAEPADDRLQAPWTPTVALVAPLAIPPFHPTSVAMTVVADVKVAFQPLV